MRREELAEVAIQLAGVVALTALGTWVAGRSGVAPGWRLAVGACGAVLLVGGARLAYYRRPPTWRWCAAIAALGAGILLANAVTDVRFW